MEILTVTTKKVWITSDLHFGHQREFLYGPRGYSSVDEMMADIVKRWNAKVGKDDDVYVLGDIMLNDDMRIHALLQLLNGHLHIIVGNHDTDRRIVIYEEWDNVVEVVAAKRLRHKKFHFYLSHYPTLCDSFDDGEPLYTKVINLCGHRHTKDPFADWDKGIIYHCELDAHNNEPVLLDDVIEDLKAKIQKN